MYSIQFRFSALLPVALPGEFFGGLFPRGGEGLGELCLDALLSFDLGGGDGGIDWGEGKVLKVGVGVDTGFFGDWREKQRRDKGREVSLSATRATTREIQRRGSEERGYEPSTASQ